MGQRRYRAFISYSHRDQKIAVKLHHALETYAIPANLIGMRTSVGEVPRRLVPIFKDRDELPAAGSLGEAVDAALAASDALIVLCSPGSARSDWVNKEIERYKQIHGGGRVFPALIEGDPDDAFPPALRIHYEHGQPTERTAEPIAADLRPSADGRRLGMLKLVAGLTGVELDQLVQRDNQRRQRRLALVAAASLAGMAATSGLAAFALQQRDEARAQRAEADGLIEYMLTDLRGKLEPVGKLDVLDGVGRKALDYYARQKLEQLSADELGRRAKAMLLVAEVGDLRGDKDAAHRGFEQAARSTAELLQRDPGNWQRVFDHAQSEFWLAYEANARGDNRAAMPHFVTYRDLGQRMLKIAPDRLESKVEAASADVNLGVALSDERKFDEALALFHRSATLFESIRPRTRDVALNAATSFGHEATALSALGRDRASIEVRQKQLSILAARPLPADDREVQEAKAIVASQLAGSALAIGDDARFRVWNGQAFAMLRTLIALDPTNQFWRSQYQYTRMNEATALFRSDPEQAKALLTSAIADQRALVAATRGKTDRSYLLRMAALQQRMGADWGEWQERLATEYWNDRDRLDDGQRSSLAAALIASGNSKAGRDRDLARQEWRKALRLLSGASRSTLDRALRRNAETRLGMTPSADSPNLKTMFAGIYGGGAG